MSKLIPRRTIDAIRKMVNVGMDVAGQECTLYIPTEQSYGQAEKLDVYSSPSDYSYTSYSTTVSIDWKPSTYKLKKLGLFVEDMLPIIVRFGTTATALEGSLAGQVVEVLPTLRSWFRITPEFVSSDYEGTEDFEIVNISSRLHDAVLLNVYSAVPRRVQR